MTTRKWQRLILVFFIASLGNCTKNSSNPPADAGANNTSTPNSGGGNSLNANNPSANSPTTPDPTAGIADSSGDVADPALAWLNITGSQDCVVDSQYPYPGAFSCLPTAKPTACTASAWSQLQALPAGQALISCIDQGTATACMLTTNSSSGNISCLPASQPKACVAAAWNKLQDQNLGFSTCIDPAVITACATGTLAPDPTTGGGTYPCLPATQPTACTAANWTLINASDLFYLCY